MKKFVFIFVMLCILFISSICVLNNTVIATTGTIGHTTAYSGNYNVSWMKGNGIFNTFHEGMALERVTPPYNCYLTCIWAYLRSSYSYQTVKCAYYESLTRYVTVTEEKNISSNVFKWYQFNFTGHFPMSFPVVYTTDIGRLGVFGNCPTGVINGVRRYIQIGSLNSSGTMRFFQDSLTYPTFPTTDGGINQISKDFSIYAEYNIYPPNSTAITTYENMVGTKGTHQTAYSSSTGWKVWANYTTTFKLRQLLNSYLSGTHEGRYNSTTGVYMSWANYSGATLKGRYNSLNSYQSGTNQNRYNSTTNIWMDWTNVSGANLISRENLINSTGTHQSRYNLSTNNWVSWANYTGSLTPINVYDNIGYSIGTHFYKQNNTGYWIWANYTTGLLKSENIIGAIGTHESIYDTPSGNWKVWANYTGVPTTPSLYHLSINLSGIVGFINWTGSLNSTSSNITVNITSNMSITGNVDVNGTGIWVYLGAMLSLDTGQFFLLILIGLWSYFIYLYYKEKEVIFTFCIICCGLPLGIIISGVAYYNSYPFGYLISFILILISFLIPTYGMYQKNKKKI
jgi:hypothetical protein